METELVPGVPTNIGLHPDLADWDNDGDLDLIIGGRRGNIGLRINVGTPTEPKFSKKPQYVEADGKPIAFKRDVSTDLVDLDGDGLRDLVCGVSNGRIVWYRNSGTKEQPVFKTPQKVANDGDDAPVEYMRISACDLNGDDKPDLLVGAKTKDRKHGLWIFLQK